MSKIQDFARQEFGIQLTEYQIELITAVASNQVLITPKRAGRTVAMRVLRAYIKEGLK